MSSVETLKHRRYQAGDYNLIRNFLVSFFHKHQLACFSLDRLNFTYSVSRIMNGTSEQQWQKQIGLWLHDGEIKALIISEGEQQGEAFMLIDIDFDSTNNDALLNELFRFCDANMSAFDAETGQQHIRLCIPRGLDACKKQLQIFGYESAGWEDIDSFKAVNQKFDVELAKGYWLITGSQISAQKRAQAHAKTWGYFDKPDYNEVRCIEAWTAMTRVPDYIEALDLCAVNEDGEIVAFVTLWLDTVNQLAMVEPVGTVPDHQRKGIAKALLLEGCNRAKKMGATRVTVGSDNSFYQSLGFEQTRRYPMYQKKLAAI